MLTLSPVILAHPAEVKALASELLELRFTPERLTEALLAIQQQARAAEQRPPSEAERLASKHCGSPSPRCELAASPGS